MPQMAPMLWLILFFYFIVLFIFYIANFYFTYSPKSVNTLNSLGESHTMSLSWSW